jgi:hypothetical protein
MVLVCWEQGSIFCICTVAVELSVCMIHTHTHTLTHTHRQAVLETIPLALPFRRPSTYRL